MLKSSAVLPLISCLHGQPIEAAMTGPRPDGEITIVLFDGDVEVARKSRPFKFEITSLDSEKPSDIKIGPLHRKVNVTHYGAYSAGKEIFKRSFPGGMREGDTVTFNVNSFGLTLI